MKKLSVSTIRLYSADIQNNTALNCAVINDVNNLPLPALSFSKLLKLVQFNAVKVTNYSDPASAVISRIARRLILA